MEKDVDVDLKKQSSGSLTNRSGPAQVFLKIICAQIAVADEEASYIKQIQDSTLKVQAKCSSTTYSTTSVEGSVVPQWHAGFTFAADPNSPIKLKLVSTKRTINTTIGKAIIMPNTLSSFPNTVEVVLELTSKKLKSAKLIATMFLVNHDAEGLARNYSVITNEYWLAFGHLNSPVHTKKAIKCDHPDFKIVLERASYLAGEVARGAIIFDLAETTDHVKWLNIKAMGVESSIWTEGSGSNQVTYSDYRPWFSLEKFIISAPTKEGVTLFAGSHVYPFELQLPTHVPSSMSHCGAKMAYLLEAEVKYKKGKKHSSQAFFNVYGQDTKFQPPLVLVKPPAFIKKHLKDNWTGEVTVSSPKQYPHQEYGLHIKYHNVKHQPVTQLKVSIKLLRKLRIQSRFERESHGTTALLKDTIPVKKSTAEYFEHDFRYTLPIVPPTVARVDDVELFELHTVIKVSVTLANRKKKYRVIPIAIGVIVPEHVAKVPRDINPDCSVATLTIYEAKEAKIQGLVAYKSNVVQFFDENIFRSYSPHELTRIENVNQIVDK